MKYITKIKLKNKQFSVYRLESTDMNFFKQFHKQLLDCLQGIEKEFTGEYNYVLLKKDIQGKSILHVVYYKEKPIAYSLVYTPNRKNITSWLNNCKIEKKDKTKIAELAGAGVVPEFRGYGMQSYLLKLREKYLKKIKFKWGVVSVHPKNIYSLINLVKNDYSIISLSKNKHNEDRLYLKKRI